ncbi:4-hydroxy-tetrahydrodipicolinate reductase [Desulfohalotomaculum tongense]|uniref:4-hydroxy-tetrahydrodipicolinate reductase n=1 Tax=Desulforadius tongensis TaxID=1216062 RepID=UPI001A9C6AA4|nr:4-hydroxy-tetrahydrodipicolinate reductase [Desulforadius tongensis]MBM7854454.1 4-hydroxy-tetrahydrodipicolinate reductase [Desulforadius tongensis]
MIKVLISGAAGRMGQESCRAVWRAQDMILAGAVDTARAGENLGKVIAVEDVDLTVQNNLETALKEIKPDVMVDFTNPEAVFNNVKIALQNNVRPVVGTTGMNTEEIAYLKELARKQGLGGLIAPNFAIGALLMIKFASMAVKYFPHVEIIELHHDQKMDAPSGTALKTAEAMAAVRGSLRQGLPTEYEKIDGVRGGDFEGMRIHSVRLPGHVAHQEVIFGGTGQTLTIRHDSISRESFMPGLLMGIRKVMDIDELVYGLENLIFE